MTTRKTPKSTAIRFNCKIQLAQKGANEVAKRLTDMGNIIPSKTSNTAKQSRVTKLLANPDVKRWFDNL